MSEKIFDDVRRILDSRKSDLVNEIRRGENMLELIEGEIEFLEELRAQFQQAGDIDTSGVEKQSISPGP